MIGKYQILNFKCINDTQLTFRPITIFCGPNSSGKSSLIQSLLLLKQSLLSTNGIHTLSPIGSIIDLGSYEDLIRFHNKSNILKYNFTITIKSPAVLRSISTIQTMLGNRSPYRFIKTLSFQLEYKYISDEEKIELDKIIVTENTNFYIESKKNKDGTYRFLYGEPSSKAKRTNPKITSLTNFLAPESNKEFLLDEKLTTFKSEKVTAIRRLLLSYFHLLFLEFAAINYLGPFRQIPNRFYMTGGAMPSDIGYRGESSIDYLSYTKLSGGDQIIKFVKYWLKKLGYANTFDIETIQSVIKTVSIQNPITHVKASLVDVGFGISQVLPVIVAIHRHNYGLHFFEQPEIHLHPKSQGDLADLFVDNIEPTKSYIIETHSEHFLNRMRLRVVQNKIKPKDIVIYYIRQTESGLTAKEITIDDLGYFKGFPSNFFDEAYQESIQIMKNRIEEQK